VLPWLIVHHPRIIEENNNIRTQHTQTSNGKLPFLDVAERTLEDSELFPKFIQPHNLQAAF
jgi:hypothetical protein